LSTDQRVFAFLAGLKVLSSAIVTLGERETAGEFVSLDVETGQFTDGNKALTSIGLNGWRLCLLLHCFYFEQIGRGEGTGIKMSLDPVEK
jgi:hypothetical protein